MRRLPCCSGSTCRRARARVRWAVPWPSPRRPYCHGCLRPVSCTADASGRGAERMRARPQGGAMASLHPQAATILTQGGKGIATPTGLRTRTRSGNSSPTPSSTAAPSWSTGKAERTASPGPSSCGERAGGTASDCARSARSGWPSRAIPTGTYCVTTTPAPGSGRRTRRRGGKPRVAGERADPAARGFRELHCDARVSSRGAKKSASRSGNAACTPGGEPARHAVSVSNPVRRRWTRGVRPASDDAAQADS